MQSAQGILSETSNNQTSPINQENQVGKCLKGQNATPLSCAKTSEYTNKIDNVADALKSTQTAPENAAEHTYTKDSLRSGYYKYI